MHYSQTTPETIDFPLALEDLLGKLIAFSMENDYALAAWRTPGSSQTQVILTIKPEHFLLTDSFEQIGAGFIFHPFDVSQPGTFIKADIQFNFQNGKLQPEATENENTKAFEWLSTHQVDTTISFDKKKFLRPKTLNGAVDFKELVQHSIRYIEHGHAEKIVPSRIKAVPLPSSFDVAETFIHLERNYSNALVSFVYTPKHGAWLGASPEILVSVEKNTFRTIALAGTQAYQTGINLKQVAWTQKEIEEQAMVSRYIINCFKKIRLREFEEHGPKTVIAGNLMHLKTDFSVDMKATNFPQLGSVMLRLLHPTSAVCGTPLESARKFLQEHEGYAREFYTGFLGPVNLNESSHLFVNLRCMQLFADKAWLYAGAGVTADSIPVKEWEETEIKMNTLLEVIG
ncbi:MAG: chorismate-binding protein [Cyclobacteriaceae bacterium]|nr:chorismate-binding protein [Cyclobacteriaceae bacterium]